MLIFTVECFCVFVFTVGLFCFCVLVYLCLQFSWYFSLCIGVCLYIEVDIVIVFFWCILKIHQSITFIGEENEKLYGEVA